MRWLPIIFLLAGCSTVDDMRTKAPSRAEYTSGKPVDVIVRCLVERVHGFGDAGVTPAEGETSVFYRPQGNTVLLIIVRRTASGSAVIVKEKLKYFARDSVEVCI